MKKILIILSALLLLCGCTAASKGTSQGAPTIQYLSTQGDGSITVRVTASGRNYADALAQANKFALRQTIFYGVPVPGNALLSKPLVTEVNAEEKYQYFFNSFFAEDGDYSQFVSSQDKRAGSNKTVSGKVSVRVSTTTRILRANLKEYLMQNNIIRP